MPGVKGLCHICGKPANLRTCWKCGKIVCEKCFDEPTGLCKKCMKKKKPEKPKKEPSELNIPESAKPTTVSPGDVRK